MHWLIISIPIQTAKIGGISIPNLQTPIFFCSREFHGCSIPAWTLGLLEITGILGSIFSTNCAPKSAGCGAGEADSCGTCGCTGGDGWWSWWPVEGFRDGHWFFGQDGVPMCRVYHKRFPGWWYFWYRGNTRKRVKDWIIRGWKMFPKLWANRSNVSTGTSGLGWFEWPCNSIPTGFFMEQWICHVLYLGVLIQNLHTLS